MSTLRIPNTVPSPAEDSEELRKAFQGWGTNEKLIISILGQRNAAQRNSIRKYYYETYGEDLVKILEKELSNDFERAVLVWTLDPADRDALLANEAARKWKSSNRVLVEIACARSSHQLLLARQAYHVRFKRSLEEDVAAHTTGDFRKILVPLVSSYRYEGAEVDASLAKSEAQILQKNIKERSYAHEEVIRILTTRSKPQLIATFNHYNTEFGNAITKDLKWDPDDSYLSALRAIIRCMTCPEKYFEKVLRLGMNKMGTDEGAVTRVITTRAEVDMKVIKDEYQRRNSVPLEKAIIKDTTGNYEDFLLALIGHDGA